MSALVISGLLLSDDMSVLPLGAPANVDSCPSYNPISRTGTKGRMEHGRLCPTLHFCAPLMRIIALVERNVCELAHISFCFCADAFLRRAETKEPRWCVALPLSTTTWVLGNWARDCNPSH